MKGIAFLSGFIGVLLSSSIILPAIAQVASDGTTNTTVNSIDNNFNILNGIQKGNNLFHSFKEFSIPTGGSAVFNNSTDVVNIINRVTGGNISNIDGLIKANGSANLFLINPAGIIFGENARLDIGGSFLGSTAESILFEDGFEFSAVNAQTEPLLTISVPLGLQMGQAPESIEVNGTGHQLSGGFPSPIAGTRGNSELSVGSDNTLALIGGTILGRGGVIFAESGRVEIAGIGSNSSGVVGISTEESGWKFDYSEIENFATVKFVEKSLIDITGSNPQGINIVGENINLETGSLIRADNFGNQQAGDINIKASGDFEISGLFEEDGSETKVISYAFADGFGSNININVDNISLTDGSFIFANTLGTGTSGTVTVEALEAVNLTGTSNLGADGFPQSSIAADTFSAGRSGSVIVDAKNVTLLTAASILSLTTSTGAGGDVIINATDSVSLIGKTDSFSLQSEINVASFGTGQAGKIEINTARLLLENGGVIEASNKATGAGGSVVLNVSESINVQGSSLSHFTSEPVFSQIRAGSIKPDPGLQTLFDLDPIPSGDSGSIIINTPLMSVANSAKVTAVNEGVGDGGSIIISGDRLNLSNQGSIAATTESGTGGLIDLNLNQLLLLRSQSVINAESLVTGNGGNITISSPVIAGFENSDIIANAVEGNGGNLNITTQGIFGLEFRDSLTSENDITASSQSGVNGTVEITNFKIDPSSGLVELPTGLTDSSQQIASGCSSNTDSTFVATGRGGIPQNPSQSLNLNSTWSDIRDLSASRQRNNTHAEVTTISNKPAIIEATGFIRNENGEIELVALENMPLKTKQVAECSGANT